MRDFNQNLRQRTDLADEAAEYFKERSGSQSPGLRAEKQQKHGYETHILTVLDERGAEASGKPEGTYITVDVGKIWLSEKQRFKDACEALAECIRGFIPDETSCLLAALGNKNIIADATGPFTAENFIVTRHIKESNPEMFEELGLRETVCISPGVLGNTGVEAAQIIRGAVECTEPGFVIAVDSLASRRLSRLATTVQICDTGISPGSGINNARKELSVNTLGIPVIAIGVPTVVEVTTLAADILQDTARNSGMDEDGIGDMLDRLAARGSDGFFVTPKETDHIIKDTAKLIGYGINLALHDGLTFDDIDEFLS